MIIKYILTIVLVINALVAVGADPNTADAVADAIARQAKARKEEQAASADLARLTASSTTAGATPIPVGAGTPATTSSGSAIVQARENQKAAQGTATTTTTTTTAAASSATPAPTAAPVTAPALTATAASHGTHLPPTKSGLPRRPIDAEAIAIVRRNTDPATGKIKFNESTYQLIVPRQRIYRNDETKEFGLYDTPPGKGIPIAQVNRWNARVEKKDPHWVIKAKF